MRWILSLPPHPTFALQNPPSPQGEGFLFCAISTLTATFFSIGATDAFFTAFFSFYQI
jgi:hypothetical protein